jgi:hypothetical protein
VRALRGWTISATMMPLAYHDSRSATDSLLQMFRVPGSLHRDLGDGVFDRRHGGAFASKPTAAKPLVFTLWVLGFLLDLQEEQRADERTRTAGLTSLRVIGQVLQGCAQDCMPPHLDQFLLCSLYCVAP